MTEFVVVIPARYASKRLPGKPLREIHGKPMLQHVWLRGIESGAQDVIIATDDPRVEKAAREFGANASMTGSHHGSGTERIGEVADSAGWGDDVVVVNLQGDEPAMPPALIDQCAALMDDPDADLSTLASPINCIEDFENPNVVKVVVDADGYAMYFSRATIPFPRNAGDGARAIDCALHHHGIYAYRCGVLRRLTGTPPSELETVEQLEQLRALSMGLKIRVGTPAERPGRGVDTEQDLAAVSRELDPAG